MIQGRGLWALNCLRWAQTVDHFGCRIWGSGLHCVVVLWAHLDPEPTSAKHKIKDPGSSIARRTGRTATTAFVLLCCSTWRFGHAWRPISQLRTTHKPRQSIRPSPLSVPAWASRCCRPSKDCGITGLARFSRVTTEAWRSRHWSYALPCSESGLWRFRR